MNLPTILVGLAVLAAFLTVLVGQARKRKKGGGCGGGCAGCPSAGLCHPQEK